MGVVWICVTILLLTTIVRAQKQRPCEIHNSVEIEFQNMKIFPNGSLHDLKDNLLYPKGTYWKEYDFFRGCICKIRPCIRKCCQRYEYRGFNGNCTNDNHTDIEIESLFKPVVFDLNTLEPGVELNNVENRFGILYRQICISDRYRLEPSESYDDRFFLLPNGSLHVPALSVSLDQNSFCMDYFADMGAVLPLVCFEPESVVSKVMYTSYPVGMIISTVFMIITLIVYSLLPELRNLHGKLLMCHVASLLVAYVTLTLVQLASSIIAGWLCITSGKSFKLPINILYNFFL